MSKNYRSGRTLEWLLTTLLVGAVALAVAIYTYANVIKPAFQQATDTLQQVQDATGAR